MEKLEFDERMAARLERIYGTRDVLRRRRLVRNAINAKPGEQILDVGCGPGFYVAELLDEVGTEGSVVGVDTSPQMLALATRRCEGRHNVAFHQADAILLPVDDASFDAALCVQVLEYISETKVALAEICRALRVGGRLVLWDVDWTTVSWHSSDPDRMERILRTWDTHLAHPALPRTLVPQLRLAGFDNIDVEGHVFATTELTPESYAGAILPLIEQFVSAKGETNAVEAKAWAAEQRERAERGEFFFACIQFCFTATCRKT